MEEIKRGYWLYTILRNGKHQTIVDAYSNPITFLMVEKEIGWETFILYAKELTKEEYVYYTGINLR